MQKKDNKFGLFRLLIIIFILLLISFFATVVVRSCEFGSLTDNVKPLNAQQQTELDNAINANYPHRNDILKSCIYTNKVGLDLLSESAVIVNVDNGDILYSKNPDRITPPASLMKLVQMYIVFEEIKDGRLKLDDTVSLPKECWASSMPTNSSLMFLGEGQNVTVSELLLGLSVASGNDASYALAYHICGGMDDFIVRMNTAMLNLGLNHTHFVESSGYSEENLTTPIEMTAFIRHYLHSYPESLQMFHSVKTFTYPQSHNLAAADKNKTAAQDFTHGIPKHIWTPVTQKNTNPMLGSYEGVDGVKTGYIDESGYNLALSATQDGLRILSVTMGGPGTNLREGNAGRVHDGTIVLNWTFSTFTQYSDPELYKRYAVPVIRSSKKQIALIPAFTPKTITVSKRDYTNMQILLETPTMLSDNVTVGQQYGQIRFVTQVSQNDELKEIYSIPLIADRSSKRAWLWTRLADGLAKGGIKKK
ncbi:MAG: D-alanyl-D-alanine carboxypeptidase [Spirochaetales bacterium]|nr:D-alanyl-D-alanine carboxypeptidase [Spirochaetales bacterium]